MGPDVAVVILLHRLLLLVRPVLLEQLRPRLEVVERLVVSPVQVLDLERHGDLDAGIAHADGDAEVGHDDVVVLGAPGEIVPALALSMIGRVRREKREQIGEGKDVEDVGEGRRQEPVTRASASVKNEEGEGTDRYWNMQVSMCHGSIANRLASSHAPVFTRQRPDAREAKDAP